MYNEDNAIEFYEQIESSDSDTFFNKLAQLPTILQSADIQKLNRRAKSKWYTEQITLPLTQLDSELNSYYTKALTCNSAIKRQGNKLTSRYCNARHCNVCNRIRTAKAINHYGKQFSEFNELEFTTLTIPNCTGQELRKTIEKMIKACSNITRIIREKKKIDYSGIRKLETTYNSLKDTFHPHFHILHNGKCGQLIINEWLKRFPTANIIAQNTKIADQNSVNELFKYTTKVLVKDSIDKNTMQVFLPAIDTILLSMKDKRSFQTFGKMKACSEDVEELQTEEYSSLDNEYYTYYEWNECNWFDYYTNEALTSFKPPNIKFKFYG